MWREVSASAPVPTFGFRYDVGLEPVQVDVERMLTVFREGVRSLREIWIDVLGRGDYLEIESLAGRDAVDFRFSQTLWTRIVIDYALAYHKRKMRWTHLLGSLVPLYIGRTASFVREMEAADQLETEAAIEELCLEFETQKPTLIKRWS